LVQAATLQAALADKEKSLAQRTNELQAIKAKEKQINGEYMVDEALIGRLEAVGIVSHVWCPVPQRMRSV
jgi:hypothetical protein